MGEVQFKPRMTYCKSLPQPLEFYLNREVAGAANDIPFFVSSTQMRGMSKTGESPAGLTVADFSLSFSNIDAQWSRVQTGASTPFWQFQGGLIYLDSSIAVYVDDRAKGRSNGVLDVIMDHELLHVKDVLDVLKELPDNLRQEQIVKNYLFDKKPADDSTFQYWFKSKKFEEFVQPIFATEHNKKGKARDSGSEWVKYVQRVSDLM